MKTRKKTREYTHENTKNCEYASENARNANTPMKTRQTAYASEIFKKKECENSHENMKKKP